MRNFAASISRIGGLASLIERISGGIAGDSLRVGGLMAAVKKTGGLETRLQREGGLFCKLWQVFDEDIEVPYLEIEPTILWVYPDFANTNNVFSNTFWRII